MAAVSEQRGGIHFMRARGDSRQLSLQKKIKSKIAVSAMYAEMPYFQNNAKNPRTGDHGKWRRRLL